MTCIELVMVAGAAYRPLLDMVPTSGGLSDQITAVLLSPVTIAVNCCVRPAVSVAVGGETVTLMDESVIVALLDLVESAWLVAVTMTCRALVILLGAQYNPLLEMVPIAGLSDQITPVLPLPVTGAVNC